MKSAGRRAAAALLVLAAALATSDALGSYVFTFERGTDARAQWDAFNATGIAPPLPMFQKSYGRRLVLKKVGVPGDVADGFPVRPLRWEENAEAISSQLAGGNSSSGGNGTKMPWAIHGRGSENVTVAVLDSGLSRQAAEGGMFRPILGGYDWISDPDYSLDGDGRDANWTEVAQGDLCAAWHGTAIATMLAGRRLDNGFHGAAENVAVQPMRVLGSCMRGTASDVADAIVYAAGGRIDGLPDNPFPAGVVLMAFSGRGACGSFLQSSVDLAVSRNVTLVAAVGNDGGDAGLYFPGNCRGVVSVGALTETGVVADYSNYPADAWFRGGTAEEPLPCLDFDLSLKREGCVGTSFAAALATSWVATTDSGHKYGDGENGTASVAVVGGEAEASAWVVAASAFIPLNIVNGGRMLPSNAYSTAGGDFNVIGATDNGDVTAFSFVHGGVEIRVSTTCVPAAAGDMSPLTNLFARPKEKFTSNQAGFGDAFSFRNVAGSCEIRYHFPSPIFPTAVFWSSSSTGNKVDFQVSNDATEWTTVAPTYEATVADDTRAKYTEVNMATAATYRYVRAFIYGWASDADVKYVSHFNVYGSTTTAFAVAYPRVAMALHEDGEAVKVSDVDETVGCTGSRLFDHRGISATQPPVNQGFCTNSGTYSAGSATKTFVAGYVGDYFMVDVGAPIVLSKLRMYAVGSDGKNPEAGGNNRFANGPRSYRVYATEDAALFVTGNVEGWTLVGDVGEQDAVFGLNAFSPGLPMAEAYQYWMVVVNKVQGGNRLQIAEAVFDEEPLHEYLALPSPPMGEGDDGVLVKATGAYPGGGEAWRAFEGAPGWRVTNAGTAEHVPGYPGEYLMVNLRQKISLSRFYVSGKIEFLTEETKDRVKASSVNGNSPNHEPQHAFDGVPMSLATRWVTDSHYSGGVAQRTFVEGYAGEYIMRDLGVHIRLEKFRQNIAYFENRGAKVFRVYGTNNGALFDENEPNGWTLVHDEVGATISSYTSPVYGDGFTSTVDVAATTAFRYLMFVGKETFGGLILDMAEIYYIGTPALPGSYRLYATANRSKFTQGDPRGWDLVGDAGGQGEEACPVGPDGGYACVLAAPDIRSSFGYRYWMVVVQQSMAGGSVVQLPYVQFEGRRSTDLPRDTPILRYEFETGLENTGTLGGEYDLVAVGGGSTVSGDHALVGSKSGAVDASQSGSGFQVPRGFDWDGSYDSYTIMAWFRAINESDAVGWPLVYSRPWSLVKGAGTRSLQLEVAPTDPSLELLYRFEADPVGKDSSGNGRDAQAFSTVAVDKTSFVRGGSSVRITPQGYLELPRSVDPYAFFRKGDGFTFATWFQRLALKPYARIVDIEPAAETNSGFIVILDALGALRIRLNDNQFDIHSTNVHDGNWHHLAFTVSAIGVWSLYIDNVYYNMDVTAPMQAFDPRVRYIGRPVLTSSDYLNARLDDFRIYSRELSATEVGEVYNFKDAGYGDVKWPLEPLTNGDTTFHSSADFGSSAFQLFDGDKTSWYSSRGDGAYSNGVGVATRVAGYPGEVVQIDLLRPVDVVAVRFWKRTQCCTERSPGIFRIYGSDKSAAKGSYDVATYWTLLHDQTEIQPMAADGSWTYKLDFPRKMRLYMLVVNQLYMSVPPDYLNFGEWELFDAPPVVDLPTEPILSDDGSIFASSTSDGGKVLPFDGKYTQAESGNGGFHAGGYSNGVYSTEFIQGYAGTVLQIDLGYEVEIRHSVIYERDGWFIRYPKVFRIYGAVEAAALGSYDLAYWTLLHDETAVPPNEGNFKRTYYHNRRVGSYRVLMLVVKELAGNNDILNFMEWDIYGAPLRTPPLSLNFSSTEVVAGKHHHVAVALTRKGERDADMDVYLDGRLAFSQQETRNAWVRVRRGDQVSLGGHSGKGSIDGVVDDFTVVPYAMDTEQVAYMARRRVFGSEEPEVLVHYKFDNATNPGLNSGVLGGAMDLVALSGLGPGSTSYVSSVPGSIGAAAFSSEGDRSMASLPVYNFGDNWDEYTFTFWASWSGGGVAGATGNAWAVSSGSGGGNEVAFIEYENNGYQVLWAENDGLGQPGEPGTSTVLPRIGTGDGGFLPVGNAIELAGTYPNPKLDAVTGPGRAKASSNHRKVVLSDGSVRTFPAWQAFDGIPDRAHRWGSGNHYDYDGGVAVNEYVTGVPGEYLMVDLLAEIRLTQFYQKALDYSNGVRAAKIFNIYGTNDAGKFDAQQPNGWTLVHEEPSPGPTFYGPFNSEATTAISTQLFFRYYMLVVRQIKGNDALVDLEEVEYTGVYDTAATPLTHYAAVFTCTTREEVCTAGQATFYRNGRYAGSTDRGVDGEGGPIPYYWMRELAGRVSVGTDGTSGANDFYGSLDDYRIYKHAMTSVEVNELYQCYVGEAVSSECGIWKQDGCTDYERVPLDVEYLWDVTLTLDTAGGFRNLTAVNDAYLLPPEQCVSGSCVALPPPSNVNDVSTYSYLALPTFNFGTEEYSAGLSFSLWFYRTKDKAGYARLFTFGTGFDTSGSSQKLMMFFLGEGWYVHIMGQNSSPLASGLEHVGQWVHFVWTLERKTATTSDWVVYADGVPIWTGVDMAYPSDQTLTVNQIGRPNDDRHPQFEGYVDSFRIHRGVLTQEDVTLLYKGKYGRYECDAFRITAPVLCNAPGVVEGVVYSASATLGSLGRYEQAAISDAYGWVSPENPVAGADYLQIDAEDAFVAVGLRFRSATFGELSVGTVRVEALVDGEYVEVVSGASGASTFYVDAETCRDREVGFREPVLTRSLRVYALTWPAPVLPGGSDGFGFRVDVVGCSLV